MKNIHAAVVVGLVVPSAWAQTVWVGPDSGGDWHTPGNWSTGLVPGAGNQAVIDGETGTARAVSLPASASVDKLTISAGDSLQVTGNTSLQTAAAGYTIDGLLELAGGADTRVVVPADDTILDGTGELRMQPGSRILGSGLLRVGGKIAGAGSIGQNATRVVNEVGGRMVANLSGQGLFFQPPNAPAAGLFNQGRMEASGGGRLQLGGSGSASGWFDNTGGVITALEGSAVEFWYGARVEGGTLTSEGTGRLRIPSDQSSTWTGLTHSGQTIVENGATLRGTGTIENIGTITVQAAAGFNTRFTLQANTVLTGAGRLVLQGTGTNAAVHGSFALTNTGGHVIEGDGYTGLNDLLLTNAPDGIVESNAPGHGMAIAPGNHSGIGVVNRGTIRARNGGVVSLSGFSGGGYDNTDGTIKAMEGSALYFQSNAVVTAGTLTTEGTGRLRIPPAHATTWTGLTHSGQTIVENGATLRGTGTIENTGTITVQAAAGFNTRFTLQADTVLTGAGRIVLSGEGTAAAVNGSFVLTNTGGHVIEGNGYVGLNDLVLTNAADGIIECNVAGQGVVIAPRLPAIGPGVTNQGLIRARNGGAVALSGFSGGSFDNTGGTIEAMDGSALYFHSNARVTGGTLTTEGTGRLRILAGYSSTWTGLTHSGQTIVEDNATLRSTGTIENIGTITVQAAAGANTRFTLQADTVLTGAGRMVLAGDGTTAAAVNGSFTLTNTGGHVIEGNGYVGLNDLVVINAADGLIECNVASQSVVIAPRLPAIGPGVTNQGLIRARNGGALALSGFGGGQFDNTGGTIEAMDGSALYFVSNARVTGGTLTTGGTGRLRIPSGQSSTWTGLTHGGQTIVEENATLRVNGLINNSGTISLTGTALISHLTLVGDTTLNGPGTVEMSGDARITGAAVLTIQEQTIRGNGNIGLNETGLSFGPSAVVQADVPGATLRLDPNPVSGLVNQGTMRAQNGALLLAAATGGGDYSIGATGRVEAIEGGSVTFESAASLLNLSGGTLTGGTWLAQGSTAATPLTLPGGVITTNAAIIILDGPQAQFAQLTGLTTNSGSLTLRNGATVSAGAALSNSGTVEVGAGSSLTAGGTITLAASSSLIHHIAAAPGVPGAVGEVNAPSNTMNLTGALTVKFDAGFPPQAGQSWKLMNGTPAGTFGTVVVQGLPAGLVAVVTYTDGVRITLNPDGLTYATWAAGHPFASPADALPTADPDHDGLDNLREYAFGGNPLSVEVDIEVEFMVVTVAAERHLGMRYWHPAGALRRLDLTYSPQRTTDVQAWQDDGFVVHEVAPPDASGRERITVRLIEPLFATVRRFIGLEVGFSP